MLFVAEGFETMHLLLQGFGLKKDFEPNKNQYAELSMFLAVLLGYASPLSAQCGLQLQEV